MRNTLKLGVDFQNKPGVRFHLPQMYWHLLPAYLMKPESFFLPFKYCNSNTYSSTETDGDILHHDRNRGSPLFVHPEVSVRRAEDFSSLNLVIYFSI